MIDVVYYRLKKNSFSNASHLPQSSSREILQTRIAKIFCNDLKNAFGEPKGKLQVVIRQKGNKLTTFRLKDYEKGGELIDTLGTLEGVTLAGYDTEMVTDHDDE